MTHVSALSGLGEVVAIFTVSSEVELQAVVKNIEEAGLLPWIGM